MKLMKQSEAKASKELSVLEARLEGLRDRYTRAEDKQVSNDIAYEGTLTRKKVDRLKAYVSVCRDASSRWATISDKEVSRLTDFKYWRAK
jgi:hypothetical protein